MGSAGPPPHGRFSAMRLTVHARACRCRRSAGEAANVMHDGLEDGPFRALDWNRSLWLQGCVV